MLFIAPIVEGQGEETALPALLHRIAAAAGYPEQVRVNPPIRVRSGSFINQDEYFRRYLGLAAEKARYRSGIVLIALDCDDDKNCPAILGPELLRRARSVRSDVQVMVSLAWREYETWFITASASLAGHHGLPRGLAPPPFPDSIRGAKEWFGKNMPNRYDPIIHQAAFTRIFDLNQARANQSFDRLYRNLEHLLATGIQPPP